MRTGTPNAVFGLAAALVGASAALADRPVYQMTRFSEDYSQFADRTDQDVWDPIKAIVLAPDHGVYLSIGGQLRLRYELYEPPNLGLDPLPELDQFLIRGLVHVDLHIGPHVRTFFQLGTTWAVGRDIPPRAVDENEATLQQAFVDVGTAPDAPFQALVRLGRHEMPLGSARLIGTRDGPNHRLSFDGARVQLGYGDVRADLLAVSAVQPNVEAFDDAPTLDQLLWGAYLTWRFPDVGLALDLYYLGLDERAVFDLGPGEHRRHTLGARLSGAMHGYDLNVETIVQLGRFRGEPILAWTVATDQGYRFTWGDHRLRLGLKANVTSGDEDPEDGRLTTFHPLFPNYAYFSQLSLISPQNHWDLHPSVTWDVSRWLTVDVGTNVFWRMSPEDAVYTPPNVPLIAGDASPAHYVGTQVSVELTGRFDRHFALTLYYSRFVAGTVAHDAGGRDTDFLGMWANYVF